MPLGETLFLNGYASNEDTEIILETARWSRYPEKATLLKVTYMTYVYITITRQHQQIEGTFINIPCEPSEFGVLMGINTFTVGE